MQNTKKLLFTAILALSALTASDSNCAARPITYDVKGKVYDLRRLDNNNDRMIGVSVPVHDTDTVAYLKRQIRDKYGIPIEEQQIMGYGGRGSNDTDTMRALLPRSHYDEITLVLTNTQDTEQRQQQQQQLRLTTEQEALPLYSLPPAYYAEPAAPAPRCATIPGQRYQIGDFVRVTVKGERKIGRVKGYMADLGLYTVDTGDKDRDFMENELNPA